MRHYKGNSRQVFVRDAVDNLCRKYVVWQLDKISIINQSHRINFVRVWNCVSNTAIISNERATGIFRKME